MATIQHDPRTVAAVTVRALPLIAILFGGGCSGLEAAPVETDFDGPKNGFEKSDGWVNGDQHGCGWRRDNAIIDDGVLTLAIDDRRSRGRDFSCGEYRTREHYGFGYYETRARVDPAEGTVAAFFTYTGPPFGNPHDEIDFEWLGRDTTQVQVNYFVDGQGQHEHMVDLGFDAAEDFHVYGFEWRPTSVRWYVDCKLVHEITTEAGPLPRTPGRIFVHLWNGNERVREWLGNFAYDGEPVQAEFDYIRHTPNGTHESSASCMSQQAEAAPVLPTEADAPADEAPTAVAGTSDPAAVPEPAEAPAAARTGAPADRASGAEVGAAPEASLPADGNPVPLGAFGAARR